MVFSLTQHVLQMPTFGETVVTEDNVATDHNIIVVAWMNRQSTNSNG